MLLAAHRDPDLVEVPLAIKFTSRSVANVGGKMTSKFLSLGSDRLVRNTDTSLG
ncbi:hypothetical protein ROS217_12911 [Roseovarius sp. 217]|nr:hypothetical protein ROS217_12911 [Roseovarius sp. 217]